MCSVAFSGQRTKKVVLLNPGGDHWFWKMMIDFMQNVSDDLDIDLEIKTSDRDHFLSIEQAREVATRVEPPDVIITGNEKSNAKEIIRIADSAGVDVFLFNNGFVDHEDSIAMGKPREVYPHWIGQLNPNNFSAGYQMGTFLIRKARAQFKLPLDSTVYIVAIAGTRKTHASSERVRGLRQAIAEDGHSKLLQEIPGDWTAQHAKVVSNVFLKRYPKIHVVWGANDSTIMGAMESARALGMIPGVHVVFGGCGWYLPALELIKSGELAVSVGGHFMEAGWSLVLINDYLSGIDFNEETIDTEMYVISKENVGLYLKKSLDHNWASIDFKKFSKKYNSALKKYNFSLDAVLNQPK